MAETRETEGSYYIFTGMVEETIVIGSSTRGFRQPLLILWLITIVTIG